ncbi:unnamed protein product [Sphagnum jensenii]|uniref:Protein SCAR n=1 Tax=Sphagnum jensenii TaxID=128206 RepID=A0ABP0W0B6_9BRYO
MPLIRYELRCEHGLANPELYRAPAAAAAGPAASDDDHSSSSKALLEGVAVAGLVGIVRQLGDLAEFAAEIFHDLHEQLRTLRVRGDGLTSRLLRLETELPAVEKALRTSTDQFRYAYIAGVQWHPSSRTDQNHCTKLDLPNFIHNYYENCHGPPRLFLLDKFDEGGEGACMKRYTDPSFYKRPHIQSHSKKERDRWNENGQEISVLGPSLCFSHMEGCSSICAKEDDGSGVVDPPMRMEQDQHLDPIAENIIPIVGGDGDDTYTTEINAIDADDDEADQVLKVSSSQEGLVQNKPEVEGKISLKEEKEQQQEEESGSSDGEQFVDALTTMDSETESEDSETQVLHDPYTDAVLLSLPMDVVHIELAREKTLAEGDDDGLKGKKLHDRTSIEKELLEVTESLEGLKLQEDKFHVPNAASETQALQPDPHTDAEMVSSLSNSVVLHTEESPNLEKELPKQALSLVGCLKLQEEDSLGLQEDDILGLAPISLLEVDDDLGYEKYSPLCSLIGSTPSFLNHFAHKTHMDQTSQREEKAPEEEEKEALDLQEQLPQRRRTFEERLQEGFDLNTNKESNSTCVSVQAPNLQQSKLDHESVSLSEAPESFKSDHNTTQNGDVHSQDSRSPTVVNETQIVEEIDNNKKETNFVPYTAVIPNGISSMVETASTTNDCTEYRKSVDETHHPFTSSSSPMSYSMSESPSRESLSFHAILHSPVTSPWSKVSSSCVLLDSSESDDSFRIHSIQSPPLAPLLAPSSPSHSIPNEKHSDAQEL